MRRHVAALAVLCAAGAAWAKPVAPAAVCEVYPEIPACAGGAVQCDLCHTTAPARNVYGAAVDAALVGDRPLSEADFLTGLPAALSEIDEADADGDGAANIDELLAGTHPADPASRPATAGDCDGVAPGDWNVCTDWDARYAFRKVLLTVCGRSPSRAELDALDGEADARAAVHQALDLCLDTEAWRGRDGALWRMAHEKIRPIQSIKSGARDPGDIPLADYDDDYGFFTYVHTDDRDVREVLTGTFLIEPSEVDGRMVYTPYDRTPQEDFAARGFENGQFVERDRRAGMMTQRWFLMSNTMFTAIPRTTAAQAYRSYLGLDIAKLEGMYPIEGEPRDYDSRGVTEPACAGCHATLDPLTYPFSRYEGIQGGDPAEQRIPFRYNGDRMQAFAVTDGAYVAETPEAGFIFGQPVANLVEWARVAADSDAFAQATTRDYWTLFMGEGPRGDETAAFTALWRGLMTTHEYRVERMLHALIDTEAFGAP